MAEVAASISRFEERVSNLKARWYFTKEELHNSPSRVHGVDPAKELSYRQQAANLIYDMGVRIGVNQLCTATAIVYMHRFFMVHSFKSFQRFTVATAALFLAAKVEEQPRKLELVAKVSYAFQNRDAKPPDPQSDVYKNLMEDISFSELLLLQTLGFEVAVEHPHQHVVKGTQLVRASKDLSQTAYFMSHNSLLLTTFCLQYPPTVVACVCIHLACRWKGIEIPLSADGKPWWEYVDKNVTLNQLNDYTGEFLKIYEMCPSKLRKKIMESVKMGQQGKEKSGESSRAHQSQLSAKAGGSDKSKGATPHAPKPKPTPSSAQHQKPHKSGGHMTSGSSSQPHKHGYPVKHHASTGHHVPGASHSSTTAHPPHPHTSHSGVNGSHSQQVMHNSTTHESKSSQPHPPTHANPSGSTTLARTQSKHHPRPPEDQLKHKPGLDMKHSVTGQLKHHTYHHHQSAPGHHASAGKGSEVVNKHRLLTGEPKHRPVSNHDSRPHNQLKRSHPKEGHDAKRIKIESSVMGSLAPLPPASQSSGVPPFPGDSIGHTDGHSHNLLKRAHDGKRSHYMVKLESSDMPPLPPGQPPPSLDQNSLMALPPLPVHNMEAPPPLPPEPPPDFLFGSLSPPPPPPPN